MLYPICPFPWGIRSILSLNEHSLRGMDFPLAFRLHRIRFYQFPLPRQIPSISLNEGDSVIYGFSRGNDESFCRVLLVRSLRHGQVTVEIMESLKQLGSDGCWANSYQESPRVLSSWENRLLRIQDTMYFYGEIITWHDHHSNVPKVLSYWSMILRVGS